MVEFGNSLDPDKEFDVLHGILDFSVDDCLEEGEIAEDWDVGDAQCLGPIPSSILMELPVTSNEELDFASNAVEYYDDNSDGALLQNASGPCAVGNKCAHCQSTKTPLWREGPLGPHTLCNACGLQYRAGCLFPEYRPAASPTFVPSQHSNDRRKIVKMMQSAAGIKIDGAPELAKHVGTSSSIIYPQIARTPEQKQVQHMHVDTSSHFSLLESSCSYSKYGSKHVGTKPSVPPLSPCKKTSCEEKLFEVPIEYDDDNSDGALLQNASNPCPAVIKRCTHCQSTKTEQWREGPLGPHTLCNACGQQYRAGRLVPEYRPHQDSNSHAMPVKMMQSTADIKIAGAPEQRKSARVQEFGSFHTQTAVSVLESSGSCTREKSLSIKSDNAIPARRSKRLRDKGINPELSTSKQTSNARRSKESRKRLPVAMDLMRNSPKNVDNSLNVSDPAYQIASGPCPPLVKKCAHCQSSETTLWRDGPLGPKTLCNACGIRYRSGRLCPEYRPLSSPTFVPSQHSDSHKKVAEMRKEAKRLKVEIKIDEVPDQTQLHVDDTSTHVSLLENSRSYLKFRSKYNNHAGAKPWLPPSSTCEKISGEETSFEMHLDESLYNSDRALLQNGSNPCPPLVKKKKKMKKCAHCGSTKTTLWRSGPLGPSTLCNACGKQYTAGRLVPDYRPKASLTFVLSQHSNKYRTFLQMRAKNDSLTADIKIAGAPEQQHVEGMHLAKHVETSTHVSLLESSPSYLRYKAKYFKHAGEHAPCVPLPSPCKKTSSVENDDDNSDGALMQNASDPCPAVIKKCAHCESTKTPRWRKGPLGPSTLCSACSDQYRAGCLVPEYRPKASPTFVPGLHSNNRSGILKMMQSAAGIEKRCAHCESTKTSKWTRGPLGPSTLCAACGHQYRAGRLVPEYRPKQVRHSYQASIPTSLQGS